MTKKGGKNTKKHQKTSKLAEKDADVLSDMIKEAENEEEENQKLTRMQFIIPTNRCNMKEKDARIFNVARLMIHGYRTKDIYMAMQSTYIMPSGKPMSTRTIDDYIKFAKKKISTRYCEMLGEDDEQVRQKLLMRYEYVYNKALQMGNVKVANETLANMTRLVGAEAPKKINPVDGEGNDLFQNFTVKVVIPKNNENSDDNSTKNLPDSESNPKIIEG